MNNKDKKTKKDLKELAADLREVYTLMSELCEQLQGGGIVQARDIEPSVARAMPTLRRAVTALNDASGGNGDDGSLGQVTAPGQSPLLM